MELGTRKAVNTVALTWGVLGTIGSLFVFPPLALVGALAVAKGVKNAIDISEEEEERRRRKEDSVLPTRSSLALLDRDFPLYPTPYQPENPLSVLARERPCAVENVMLTMSSATIANTWLQNRFPGEVGIDIHAVTSHGLFGTHHRLSVHIRRD